AARGVRTARAAAREQASLAPSDQRAGTTESRARAQRRWNYPAPAARARRCACRRGGPGVARAIRLASDEDTARVDIYLKIPKWPSSHQSRMKIRTVLKQPPPSFFAPYPAATPRSSLLIPLS